MTAKKVQSNGWPVKAANPPKLADDEWVLVGITGVVLIVMAILQLANFADFKDALSAMGLTNPTAWGCAVIIAEFWGAAGFFKLKLSLGFRYVSYALAILAASFWFVTNLQVLASGTIVKNSGFFGRFLAQAPGWWTVVEVSVLLFWVLFKVGLLRDNQQ